MFGAKEKMNKKEESKLDKIKNPDKVLNAKRKKKILIVITTIIAIALIILFSVVFAFAQKGKNTIVKGIKAKNVELSNLTIADAKEKLVDEINKELKTPIKLVYNDYFLDINISEVEFNYNLDEMLNEAYSIGRGEDIVKSNYTIIDTIINGKEIEAKYTINEEALNNIIANVDTSIPGKVIESTYDIEDDELVITPGKDGVVLKNEELKNLIIDSIKNRDSSIENKDYQEIQIPVENKIADPIDVEKIYSEIYCEPQDAYLIKEPFQLFKDVNGIDFAISMDEVKAKITGDKEEYTIPLKITPAAKKVADLGNEAFPQTLSTFSTEYNAGFAARSTNLRIAANKINGTVLLPGEEFSFNKIVGKRTVQDGYQNAPIYENGKVVDGLAGGICQISSTLYNAVLLANLEIVERRNHNFTSTYVPAGRDATVVYGAIDFKFKNSRQYPIKIIASVSGGTARFEIKGLKEETEYDVKIYTKTIEETPFSEEIEEDSSLAPGTRTVIQAGHNGSKVNSYRALYLNGTEVSRELIANDTYKSMTRIVKVSPETPEQTDETPIIEDLPQTQPVTEPVNSSAVDNSIPDATPQVAEPLPSEENTVNSTATEQNAPQENLESQVENSSENSNEITNPEGVSESNPQVEPDSSM